MKLLVLILVCSCSLVALAKGKSTTTVKTPLPAHIFPEETATEAVSNANSVLEGPTVSHGDPRAFGLITTTLLGLPLLIMIGLLSLIPIPVITVPSAPAAPAAAPMRIFGRALQSMLMEQGQMRGILESSTCVQRISCELMKNSSTSPKWIKRIVSGIPMSQDFKWKIKRMSNGLQECGNLRCNPVKSVLNFFKSDKKETVSGFDVDQSINLS